MLPTLLAAAGVPDVKEQLLKGMKVGDRLQGPPDGSRPPMRWQGIVPVRARIFFYFNDDGRW